MLQLILTAIGSWLPSLGKAAVDVYRVKVDSDNKSEKIAADLAARELAVQQREIEVDAQYKTALIGHPFEPVNLLGYITVLYFGKVVVWDVILGLGSTPTIKGAVGDWMGLVIMSLVGKRGIENVAKIIRK